METQRDEVQPCTATLSFKTDAHQVRLSTFIRTMASLETLIGMCAEQVDPESKLTIVLDNARAGCFEADISFLTEAALSLKDWVVANSETIRNVLGSVADIVKLADYLRKRSNNPIVIRTDDISKHELEIPDSVIESYLANKDIRKAAESLLDASSDSDTHGIVLKFDDELYIDLNPYNCDHDTEIIIDDVFVDVISPVLEHEKALWTLRYNNEPIKAKMEDEQFLNKLSKISFTLDTELKVRLRLKQTSKSTKYYVEKVYGVY